MKSIMGLAIFKNILSRLFSSRECKGEVRAKKALDLALYEASIKMEAERRFELERAFIIAGLHNSKQNDLTIN